ncbi:MAG TPA: NAD(P)-dependent oxidoreductase [Acidimicrobiia bacterium]|nr:NAD(P)-dependent oxidoreductase [Acidimicrobiia bacterium]
MSHPSAELTVSLILACARRLVPEITAMREGGWQCRLGESLPGATIGLIGLGRVGS